MSVQSRFGSLIRNLFHRRRVDRDLDDELRSYVDLLTDENRDAGMTSEAARRAALVRTRGVIQVKERVQDVRAGAAIEQTLRDVSYGVRMAIRNRGFTLAAVVTLALGIGASTAMFSLVDTIVFRPLPYADSERLVKIWGSAFSEPADVSFADFRDISQRSRSFEQVAADDGTDFAVEYEGSRESVNGALVTPEWLTTLGVRPTLGRGFLPEEAQPGRDHVVILTEAFWRHRFLSDPSVVGKHVVVEGKSCTIVGVLPPNVLRYSADFIKPLVPAEYPTERGHRDLDVLARLRRGVTPAAAQAEMNLLARQLEAAYPSTNTGRGLRVVPLGKYYTVLQANADRGLLLMFGAVALVLLIACVNVANLLLARAAARSRECVIRTALGASRGRIVRQLLVENMLLFLTGGVLGSLFAWWSVDSIVAFAMSEGYIPDRMVVSIDSRVLTFSVLTSVVTGLGFGLAPALRASKIDMQETLRDSARTVSTGPHGGRARRLLIVSELTISLVLLVGFGLLVRSFVGLHATTAGFVPDGLLETGSDAGRSFTDAVSFWNAALARTRSVPGVRAAAVSSRPPVHGAREKRFAVEGRPDAAPGQEPRAGDILISGDYFRTVGIPLVQGRSFTDRDTQSSTPVAVVSQTLARRYFPNQDPIGQRVRLDEEGQLSCCMAPGPVENVWREIVGVVGDIRQANLDEAPAATLYRPYSQIVEHDMFLMVRANSVREIPELASDLKSALRSVDPSRSWWDIQPMRRVIDQSDAIRSRRFILILLGGFAGLALVLAAVGLYGVMAYSVLERRREIAVRMALGATRPAVLKQVLNEATRLIVMGLAFGAFAAYFLTRLIASLLFGVTPTDATTYVTVSGLLAAVALLASYLPARRASQIDPIVAFREP